MLRELRIGDMVAKLPIIQGGMGVAVSLSRLAGAVAKEGGVMGQGHGLQGKSYAINSMSGISEMEKDIKLFCEFAKSNPQKHFLVTPIGCGIAGFSPNDVAPLFKKCAILNNVSLPRSFWQIIGYPKE